MIEVEPYPSTKHNPTGRHSHRGRTSSLTNDIRTLGQNGVIELEPCADARTSTPLKTTGQQIDVILRRQTEGAFERRQSEIDGAPKQGLDEERLLETSSCGVYQVSKPVRAVLEGLPGSEQSQKEMSNVPPTSTILKDHDPSLATSFGVEEDAAQESSSIPAKPLDKGEQSSTLRPILAGQTLSTPVIERSPQAPARRDTSHSESKGQKLPQTFMSEGAGLDLDPSKDEVPLPSSIPLPPLSIPTYLQLELSSQRPFPLNIRRPITGDFPYESSQVKIERLLNFLCLPLRLEGVLCFGTLACFDAWLYTFTILPLRLLKCFYILAESWTFKLASEARFMSRFVYKGTGRVWHRRFSGSLSASGVDPLRGAPNFHGSVTGTNAFSEGSSVGPSRHTPELGNNFDVKKITDAKGASSTRSALLPDDKADILKGLLIIATCLILMRFDASRMYHWIRGQAAIKLYVIYNVLEVCDRLFSAIGQDVLECLFSRESLERKANGHSKVLRPLWLFFLALIYTVIHSTALFYQVITLNVAVNSYSNALITLLMSNQFVEIKSTVFKKFEKENLFQLTCADVVERFQLWLMLTIIASRNIVETGGLSVGFTALSSSSGILTTFSTTNTSSPLTQAMPPRSSASIIPSSFMLMPALLNSLTAYAPSVGQVLGPFLVVLGSEMLVDWLKHAYIGKFNNTRPVIYSRFLDVLAKDYYTNAFGDQNLTKRLGLPVIPLSCLFIRASLQSYYMFRMAWIPTVPSPASTLLDSHSQYITTAATASTSTAVALSQRLDELLQHIPASISSSSVFTNFTTILLALLIFLVLLALKLVLGMVILSFAQSRYRSMNDHEKNPIDHIEGGRRVGGWGAVEVDQDKRRWIYNDDREGARALKEREEREKAKQAKGTASGAFDNVKRYELGTAKRIW